MYCSTDNYTLCKENVEGICHYFISFIDGQGEHRKIEVAHPVYNEFINEIKAERNLQRWDERHIDKFGMTEEKLNRRAAYPPKHLEDIVLDRIRSKRLYTAIQRLPEKRRRRFNLYYRSNLTYEQIAKIEGCTMQAVAKSVKRAREKIIHLLQERVEK